jgi:hypothetical protein
MSVSDLEIRGVKMPPPETFLGDLSAAQIVEKINSFHQRLSRESHLNVAPFSETYFLNLLALYPVSMCSKTMTDELKLVAALFFFGSQPQDSQEVSKDDEPRLRELFPRIKPSATHKGYSVEDLGLIFDRNPIAIAEAVRQKQEEAQVILEEAALRSAPKSNAQETPSIEALSEALTEEEKHALAQGKPEATRKQKQGADLCS